jgi:hypothetical protein
VQANPGVHSVAYPMDKGPSELTSYQSRLMEDKNVRRFTSFDTVHFRVELQGTGPPMTCLDKHSSTPIATRRQKEVGGQHGAPAALSQGKTRYPSYRRLVGLGAGRSGMKNLAPPGIDSLISLYVLRYPSCHFCCGTQI